MTDPRIIDMFNRHKDAPFPYENGRLLALFKVGSHSHGTHIKNENSQLDDVDYVAIITPPIQYSFGLSTWEGFQAKEGDLDVTFFSTKHFFELLVKSNPNVLSLLWHPKEFIMERAYEWDLLLQHREKYSSLAAYESFVGYANSQLGRMTHFDIKTQNEFDAAIELIEAAGWTKEQVIRSASLKMFNEKAVFDILDPRYAHGWGVSPDDIKRELEHAQVTIRKIHARHFQGFMGEKRKQLVRKFGYDVKNAAHLVRLLRMCCEFLETGQINVYRTHDREQLMSIKSGEWTLDAVKAMGVELRDRAKELATLNPMKLPEKPDREFVSAYLVTTLLSVYNLVSSSR